jgi:CRISP-associated protein Cas1
MIKRTVLFGHPTELSSKNDQLVWQHKGVHAPTVSNDAQPPPIEVQEDDFLAGIEALHRSLQKDHKNNAHYNATNKNEQGTIPIEDIGVLLLDNPDISLTNHLLSKLVEHNVAVVVCGHTHHPIGLLQPIEGHSLQSSRYAHQITSKMPLRKQLWQRTVQAKIINQASVLAMQGHSVDNMARWASQVRSGDSKNCEATAAVYYWKNLFVDQSNFVRHPDGVYPNNLLNYGYAILRAIVARGLVSSGLLPTLGIFHKNQYNAYCLADDIMEPYRPFVDLLVLRIVSEALTPNHQEGTLTTALKQQLLAIPVLDVDLDGGTSPLSIAVSRTTASLAKCYAGGSAEHLVYPKMGNHAGPF